MLKTGLDHVPVSLIVNLYDAALAVLELDPDDVDAVTLGGRCSDRPIGPKTNSPTSPRMAALATLIWLSSSRGVRLLTVSLFR